MTREEINKRLHHFNLYGDWSVFNDIPEEQQHEVMYPHVMRLPSETDDTYKAKLVSLFGELEN